MSRFTDDDRRAARGRQPGRRRRWSAAEKAGHLAAFRRSGLSATAFCRRAGVPRATFTLWQHAEHAEREAHATRWRHATVRPVEFARVEVRPGVPDATARPTGITVRLHDQAAVIGELIGLDAETALRVLRSLVPLIVGLDRECPQWRTIPEAA